jgi:hypothetical protein
MIKFLAIFLFLLGFLSLLTYAFGKYLSVNIKTLSINLLISIIFYNKIYSMFYISPLITNMFIFIGTFNTIVFIVYYYLGGSLEVKYYSIIWLVSLPILAVMHNILNVNLYNDKLDIQIKRNTDLIYYNNINYPDKKAFANKVKSICKDLKINPNHLMAIMYLESGLNSKNVNLVSNATGLIQFMPSTAIGMSTTVEKLKTLDAIIQLDYVKAYFKNYSGSSFYDLYLYVFYPKAINKPDNYIFPKIVCEQNPGFDINSDKVLVKYEVKKFMYKFFYLYKNELSL